MKLKMLAAAAAALVASAPSMATIALPSTGNGELFLSVFDSTAKVSYTLDLGIAMDTFLVDAQAASGYDRSWNLALPDGNFTSFLSQVAASNLRWAVMAGDSFGPITFGGQRLLTTVRAGTAASVIASPLNQQLTTGTGATALGVFVDNVNNTGTHRTQADGSSVNAETDGGRTYFGEIGGTGPSLNTNFITLRTDSAVGESTSFWYMTRSSNNNAATVALDQFNNQGSDGISNSGAFSLTAGSNGYTLNYNLQPVPEPSTYALLLAGIGCVGLIARRRQAAR